MHAIEHITWILAVALLVVPLASRFGLPSVIGYLLSGMLIGPHVAGLIENTAGVVSIAEYGIAMLMFVIGLELEPSRLWVLRRSIFGFGTLQVLVTGGLIALLFRLAGIDTGVSLIAGLGLALSSTAFALQLLAEKNQLSSRHGRKAFAVLLFQDMAVIPLLAMMPLLAGPDAAASGQLPRALPVLATFAGLVIASRFLVRPVFRFIANSQTPELFTGMALFIIVGITWLMESIHLSMSLGAFMAGMLLADSEYRHELEAQIQPFKQLLLGLFFMTVGMTANLPLLMHEPHWILLGAILLMVLKGLVLWGIGRGLGHEQPTSVRLGITLAQGGEFAFIVFTSAVALGLMDSELGERLVLVVTLSMALTPLGFWLLEHVLEPRLGDAPPAFDAPEALAASEGHEVIIAGFGRVGQIIARVLRVQRIGFVAIESSARQVDFVRRFGNQVFYGRPDNLSLLEAAGIQRVKLLVLAIDNVEESLRTARLVRHHFPRLPVYARARDRMHAYQLMDLGVHLVHRETYLTSLEMAREVLVGVGFDDGHAGQCVERFREYDERLILRQHAIYQNEAALVESAKQSMKELEGLFDSDTRAARREASGSEKPPA